MEPDRFRFWMRVSMPSVMDFDELGFMIRILREVEVTILAFGFGLLLRRGVVTPLLGC